MKRMTYVLDHVGPEALQPRVIPQANIAEPDGVCQSSRSDWQR
jgi:hypothetical protein